MSNPVRDIFGSPRSSGGNAANNSRDDGVSWMYPKEVVQAVYDIYADGNPRKLTVYMYKGKMYNIKEVKDWAIKRDKWTSVFSSNKKDEKKNDSPGTKEGDVDADISTDMLGTDTAMQCSFASSSGGGVGSVDASLRKMPEGDVDKFYEEILKLAKEGQTFQKTFQVSNIQEKKVCIPIIQIMLYIAVVGKCKFNAQTGVGSHSMNVAGTKSVSAHKLGGAFDYSCTNSTNFEEAKKFIDIGCSAGLWNNGKTGGSSTFVMLAPTKLVSHMKSKPAESQTGYCENNSAHNDHIHFNVVRAWGATQESVRSGGFERTANFHSGWVWGSFADYQKQVYGAVAT